MSPYSGSPKGRYIAYTLTSERLTEAEPGTRRVVAAGLSRREAIQLRMECARAIRAFGMVGVLAVDIQGPAPGLWQSIAYAVTVIRVSEN